LDSSQREEQRSLYILIVAEGTVPLDMCLVKAFFMLDYFVFDEIY
jgi:hypothetical protein